MPDIVKYVIIGLVVLFVIVFLILMLREKKYKWLKRKPRIEESTVMPLNRDKEKVDFTKMLGLKGKAITDLRPVGHVEFGGEIFEVSSMKGFISVGTLVFVVKIEGSRLIVDTKKF